MNEEEIAENFNTEEEAWVSAMNDLVSGEPLEGDANDDVLAFIANGEVEPFGSADVIFN